MTPAGHPALRTFLGGWFHQDFDLVGETLAAIVAAYTQSATLAERRALQGEIRQFLQQAKGRVDAEFERQFEPEVDPAALAVDAEDFLLTIDWLLDAEATA
ncbi:MAG: contact-dependent growth inhibition system immunity protein [Pseudomonadota bacterium]|nr:contact-dependent growth inhibition system immunity protein [Pseudomonadota bacterium]